MIYLLDTNTLSRFLRAKDVRLRDTLGEHLEECHFSTVVLYELEYCVAKRPDLMALRQRVDSLRAMFPALAPFDDLAAFQAAQVRAYLEGMKPNAQPIGHYDLLLAGQSLALGATIVTHNRKEFERVPGLKIEDWQTP